MEQDLLLGMVKELRSSERGLGGESCNSDTWKGCPAPLQMGAPFSVPLSLSHSYMCCHVKKRNCRLLEKFEKLMHSVVGNWSRKISGRESRNLKAGNTVDVIIK